MKPIGETYFVGFDISNDDTAILTISEPKNNGSMEVLNVIQGEEVIKLYKILTLKNLIENRKVEI